MSELDTTHSVSFEGDLWVTSAHVDSKPDAETAVAVRLEQVDGDGETDRIHLTWPEWAALWAHVNAHQPPPNDLPF